MSNKPLEPLVSDWVDIIPTFLKIPWNAYKYRHPIQHYWKVLQTKLKSGKTNIIILGKPLVGKTEFMRYLTGEAAKLSYAKSGTSFDTEDSVVSFGKWSKILRTVPGQELIGRKRYEELTKSFSRGNKLEGVIYVVDYGYTDFRDDAFKEKKITEEDIDLKKLRTSNLEEEAIDFEKICDRIEQAAVLGIGPKWMIILANKADLFAKNEELKIVQEYYSEKGVNRFAKRLRTLQQRIGLNNMLIQIIPISSYPENFNWGTEKVLTNLGETEARKALLKNFVSTVNFLDNVTS